MSVWSLTYQQSILSQWQTFLTVFIYKMAAKINWHRYGTKLGHCHPTESPHSAANHLLSRCTHSDLPTLTAWRRLKEYLPVILNVFPVSLSILHPQKDNTKQCEAEEKNKGHGSYPTFVAYVAVSLLLYIIWYQFHKYPTQWSVHQMHPAMKWHITQNWLSRLTTGTALRHISWQKDRARNKDQYKLSSCMQQTLTIMAALFNTKQTYRILYD